MQQILSKENLSFTVAGGVAEPAGLFRRGHRCDPPNGNDNATGRNIFARCVAAKLDIAIPQ